MRKCHNREYSDGHQKTRRSELPREETKASCEERLHLHPEKWAGFATHSNMQSLILGRKKQCKSKFIFPLRSHDWFMEKKKILGNTTLYIWNIQMCYVEFVHIVPDSDQSRRTWTLTNICNCKSKAKYYAFHCSHQINHGDEYKILLGLKPDFSD